MKIQNKFWWALIGLSLVMFGFAVWRAINLSVAHDEAVTYLLHVPKSYTGIFTYKSTDFIPENNHPLSTALAKFFTSSFVDNILFFRLGSLLGLLFYLGGLFIIATGLKDNWQKFILFILMLFNPFVFDFMSVARGYGLGAGLLVLGLSLLLISIKNSKTVFLLAGFLLLSLAVLAHASFLYAYLAVLVAWLSIILVDVLKNKSDLKTISDRFVEKFIVPVTPSLFVVYFLAMPFINGLANNKNIYFGGADNWWSSMVMSLINAVLFNANYPAWLAQVLGVLILFIVFCPVLVVLIKREKFKNKDLLWFWFSWLTLIISVAIVITNVKFNHSLYPIERAGLFLLIEFLVYMTCLILNFSYLLKDKIKKIFLSVLSIIIISHFVYVFTPLMTYVWPYDKHTKEVMEYIKRDSGGKRINIGIDWLFEPSINYYIVRDKLNIDFVDRGGINERKFDYYVLFDNSEYTKAIKDLNLSVIKEYTDSKVIIAKPNK
ncbi:hypothetical protein COT94_01890 [Candidatus Falkowbacteria bacterium CG10_big_fil_rev_8_21_14_0_10_37_14]|uniref:Glycosyltransferase RgtA/B/C/D-like domain-containing protein n=1 Tax=Candidatus Falkowbacteria bacterium CG10_big_fil_rev_8_21_14_0_10_37_14 TaxID=1974561 RepID=A0A2M6WTS4_9BACT|nr:hypothetical protein [Candidatus Falkowbacteria bacterium]PIT96198.1 MAG: hypothetical protein COT94_01890 [Candidatus Falkowbacteria bacterium CG10_big_fil_rev_8_21_14_0_10_37_14]